MSSMQTKIWFYYSSGKEYGPFDPDGIIERARTGEITPDTLVRRHGRDYCEAHNLSFLATAFDDAHTAKPRRNHDGDVVRTGKPPSDKVPPPVPDSNGFRRGSASLVPPAFPDSIDSNKGARSQYPPSKALPVQKPAESDRNVRAKALAEIIGLSFLILVIVVGSGMVFLAPFLTALKRSQKEVEQSPWNDNQLAEQFASGLPPNGFSQKEFESLKNNAKDRFETIPGVIEHQQRFKQLILRWVDDHQGQPLPTEQVMSGWIDEIRAEFREELVASSEFQAVLTRMNKLKNPRSAELAALEHEFERVTQQWALRKMDADQLLVNFDAKYQQWLSSSRQAKALSTAPTLSTMDETFNISDRIERAKARIASRQEEAERKASLSARDQVIADQFTAQAGSDYISQRIAKAKGAIAIKNRQEQRQFAEQADPEMVAKTKNILQYISNSSNRFGAIEALRQLSPEEQDAFHRLAPGVMQQLGDDRGNIGWRAINALWKGTNERLINPFIEFTGGWGLSADEIGFARELEALRQQEAAPARPDDPWHRQTFFGASEMTPWVILIAWLLYVILSIRAQTVSVIGASRSTS